MNQHRKQTNNGNTRWWLDRNNVFWHPEIPSVSDDTNAIPEQKKITSWTPNGQATDKRSTFNFKYGRKITNHWSPMQTEKSQLSGQRYCHDTVNLLSWIICLLPRSALKTDDRFYLTQYLTQPTYLVCLNRYHVQKVNYWQNHACQEMAGTLGNLSTKLEYSLLFEAPG